MVRAIVALSVSESITDLLFVFSLIAQSALHKRKGVLVAFMTAR
jgi:hypothetical protein